LQKAHQAAVQVIQKADQMIEAEHYNKERMLQIVESITSRWQQLMFRAEERLKLVMASMNWFKTAEQVCSVLDSLEREYKRDEDWLAADKSTCADERAASFAVLIQKHLEQKEAFLKVGGGAVLADYCCRGFN
jgi:hypothetical protein